MKQKLIEKQKIIIFLMIFLVVSYLLINTGIHGDDLPVIIDTKKINNFNDWINYGFVSSLSWIYGPFNFLLFYWVYPVVGENNLYIYVLFYHNFYNKNCS